MKSFLRWVEETTDGSPALSEPQDKKGEVNMSLAKIVENRIKALIRNLGPEEMKKGSEQEIIAAIMDYVGKMGGQPQQQNQAPPTNDQGTALATQEAQPQAQQLQAMNPVA